MQDAEIAASFSIGNGPDTDRIYELMVETTRAMARNVAEQLYRPTQLSDWLALNAPPPKPLSKAEIELKMSKNRLADKLIELASWLKGYVVTGGDW